MSAKEKYKNSVLLEILVCGIHWYTLGVVDHMQRI